MAVWRTRAVPRLSGASAGAESPTGTIGPITLDRKQAGKPSAGNPHAGFDVAGTGNRLTARIVRYSQRKRRAKRIGRTYGAAAPGLDPTRAMTCSPAANESDENRGALLSAEIVSVTF